MLIQFTTFRWIAFCGRHDSKHTCSQFLWRAGAGCSPAKASPPVHAASPSLIWRLELPRWLQFDLGRHTDSKCSCLTSNTDWIGNYWTNVPPDYCFCIECRTYVFYGWWHQMGFISFLFRALSHLKLASFHVYFRLAEPSVSASWCISTTSAHPFTCQFLLCQITRRGIS